MSVPAAPPERSRVDERDFFLPDFCEPLAVLAIVAMAVAVRPRRCSPRSARLKSSRSSRFSGKAQTGWLSGKCHWIERPLDAAEVCQ